MTGSPGHQEGRAHQWGRVRAIQFGSITLPASFPRRRLAGDVRRTDPGISPAAKTPPSSSKEGMRSSPTPSSGGPEPAGRIDRGRISRRSAATDRRGRRQLRLVRPPSEDGGVSPQWRGRVHRLAGPGRGDRLVPPPGRPATSSSSRESPRPDREHAVPGLRLHVESMLAGDLSAILTHLQPLLDRPRVHGPDVRPAPETVTPVTSPRPRPVVCSPGGMPRSP